MGVIEAVSAMDRVLPLIHMDISPIVLAKIALHAGQFLNTEIQQLQVPEKNQDEDGYIACDFMKESVRISEFLAE